MVEAWLLDDKWVEENGGDEDDFLSHVVDELAERFFLSDNLYLPDAGEDYHLGYLEPEDWWPLVNQLVEMVDLEAIVELAEELVPLLNIGGVPTQLLEEPLEFLEIVLEGDLLPASSGRSLSGRKVRRIALLTTRLAMELPDTAQAAIQAWAGVQRALLHPLDEAEDADLTDLLFSPDLPVTVTGFSMIIAMTLMRWPERAEGAPVPEGFVDPDLYDEILSQWQTLHDSPAVTEEGAGDAEALFAQGQLAHLLAQLGTVERLESDEIDQGEVAMAYSRLSRAILWLHEQCRHCQERDGVACKVATSWPERPVPLLDVASEVANTGRIEGCVRM